MPAARQLARDSLAIETDRPVALDPPTYNRAVLEFPLYCPACCERIHRGPVQPDMDELLTCTTCFAETKRADLLVSSGVTLLDHLVALNSAKK